MLAFCVQVTTLAFANFSHRLAASPPSSGGAEPATSKMLVDYSQMEFSRSQEAREEFGGRLAVVADFLERELGCPQDVEGCFVGSDIYLVQSRPQL